MLKPTDNTHRMPGDPPEGQGSQLLRELAKIELQAAVGKDLVQRVSDRFADYALDSPGNLRLCRTLLNDRSIDESGFEVRIGEDIEIEDVEGADDATEILELWNLLLDAEKNTILGGEGELTGVGAPNIGRAAAVTELQRVFVELEIRLGSYEIQTDGPSVAKVEGKNRLSEEIVEREGN